MKCPVCGKHVAEERYELHVGRHTHAAPGDEGVLADEETESVPADSTGPAAVGAAAAGVDAGALLLGPRGDAVPLADDEAPADGEAPTANQVDGAADDTGPVAADDTGPVADAPDDSPPDVDTEAVTDAEAGAEPDALAGPEVIAEWDDEPVLDPTAPLAVEPTSPLPLEPPPTWEAPVPAGGQRLAPFPAEPGARRRSTLPLLGLVALVAVAAVVAYALSSDDDDASTSSARVRSAVTTTTVTFPSFPAAPTATTAPPAALRPTIPPAVVPPVPPGGGITTPPPGAGSGTGLVQVQADGAVCDENSLTVNGTVANNGGARSNVTFSVTIVSAGGQPLGTARTAVAGLNPGERRPFQASGTCSGQLGPGDRPVVQIESVTPA